MYMYHAYRVNTNMLLQLLRLQDYNKPMQYGKYQGCVAPSLIEKELYVT